MADLEDTNIFPVKMMTVQFRALKDYISRRNIETDLRQSMQTSSFRQSSRYNRNEVEKWLTNGWNTENILIASEHFFDDPENSYAIQWVFPQAYYSCFCITLAFFKTAGYVENKHSSIIKKIGCLIKEGKYPNFISFYTDGGIYQISLSGVNRFPVESTVQYNPDDESSMQNQISQFLNATRERDLKRKKKDMRIKTKQGNRKKSFNRQDWETVSEKLGTTNILSLLYRKRIKFNYDNIETVFSRDLDAHAIYQSLLFLVSQINLIHESYIFNILEGTEYNNIIVSQGNRHEFINERFEKIKTILPQE